VHNLMVHDNVFSSNGRSAIEFTNARNDPDGNVYGNPPGPAMFGQPFLRVKFPEPPEWDNLKSWREQHGWDMNGTMADITAVLDPDKLELTMTVKGDVKPLPIYKHIDSDIFGKPVTGDRVPGPFTDMMTASGPRAVDPR